MKNIIYITWSQGFRIVPRSDIRKQFVSILAIYLTRPKHGTKCEINLKSSSKLAHMRSKITSLCQILKDVRMCYLFYH